MIVYRAKLIPWIFVAVVENVGSNPTTITMKKDKLKKIEGYDRYYVSCDGEVYSFYKNGVVKKLSKRINKGGYYYVNLCKNAIYKSIGVHRLVALCFLDSVEGCNIVNHIDCNKLNNNVENLEFTTYQGNAMHASKNNRLDPRKGEDCNLSKLTEQDVREIRASKELSQKELGEKYNVSKSTVNQILRRIIWKHI